MSVTGNHQDVQPPGTVKLRVELGRQWLSSHDVSRLGPGSVLELQNEADAEVAVLSSGKCCASGVLVEVEGVLGVRVTRAGELAK